jgi:cell filamentation protein
LRNHTEHELRETNILVRDASFLLKIHRYLFQDVYSWAGQLRTVEISKDDKPFFSLGRFNMGLAYIDQLIADYKALGVDPMQTVARSLATILDAVNFLHPFREGNGRTQRELLRILAQEKGLNLDLNPVDSNGTYKRYMMGTINGDIEVLTQLIIERCTPITHDVN